VGDALPAFDGLALAAARLPAAGTGDPVRAGWYDVAATDDGHVVSIAMIATGDTGRVSAAVVEPARRALAGMQRERHSPAAGLAQLDHAVRHGADSPTTTALFVTFDLTHGVLRWSRAGHRPPLIVGPGGGRYLAGDTAGPLGGPRAERFAEAHDRIAAGSTVVLVADGAEAQPDALDDLATAVAQRHELTPEALVAALCDRLPAESGRTLLVARVMPLPLEERRSAEPRQLAAVRRTVRAWSALAALSDDCSADLQLLLSEAASNSVEHAYRGSEVGEFAYEVRRRANGGVRVAVQDFGRWRAPAADPGYRGRGLALIKNLAEEVTLDVGDTGTRLAFTVPAGPPHQETEELRR
jgi:anti-sigma regulatory factor (Ser/Thr protein kinase)